MDGSKVLIFLKNVEFKTMLENTHQMVNLCRCLQKK
nr:MAG TPA: hypothetical protein [Caudoviricetes sp.]